MLVKMQISVQDTGIGMTNISTGVNNSSTLCFLRWYKEVI